MLFPSLVRRQTNLKLPLSIGWRFLKSSKGQTLLIVIGILIGVAVQVFVGSLIEGLQASLVDGTIGNSSQVTVLPEEKGGTFEDDADLIEQLANDERISAASKSFSRNGFIIEEEDETLAVFLRGFEFEEANEIYNFEDAITDGEIPSAENEVMIGVDLADESELSIGDTLDFAASTDSLSELEVVGIFDLGVTSLNESWVVTELETAQTVFEEENQLTNIETQVNDVFAADTVANDILAEIGEENFNITNWKEENESLLSGLSGQSISSYMIQVFVLVAVLLGIASVLAISAVQKSKQLGILKAMGIKDKIAGRIFLFQGFILGTIGSILGALVGIGLMYAFSVFVTNPDGSSLVPFYVDPQFVLLSVGISIVASTIAAFIPAKNSSRLNPIEVIQNG